MSVSGQELYKLNSDGQSYESIALQKDMSRSAVAGKISRWKKKNNINTNYSSRKNRTYSGPYNPVKKAEVKTTVVPLNIDLEDLKNRQCRYPYGEGPYTFCGHPVKENPPYCTEHHTICIRVVKHKPVDILSNFGTRR